MKIQLAIYDLINRSTHLSEEGRFAEANLNLNVVKYLIHEYINKDVEITQERLEETFNNVKANWQ